MHLVNPRVLIFYSSLTHLHLLFLLIYLADVVSFSALLFVFPI